MNAKREARRKRNLEDFARTQEAMPTGQKGAAYKIPPGPTYREHLENKLDSACKKYRSLPDGDPTLRGVIRGLAIALLIYEDSYNMNNKQKLLKIERQFMED